MIIEGDEELDRLADDLDRRARSISRQTRGVMARHLDNAAAAAKAAALARWTRYGRGESGSAGTIRARMGRVGSRGGSVQEGFLLADGDGAWFQEHGTAHHPPQPVMGEAVDGETDALADDLADLGADL